MEPLKITFKVANGVVKSGLPIHLDALLAYAVTERNRSDIEDNPTIETLRALGEDLPLDKHAQSSDWVWKASALMPVGDVYQSSSFYTQRINQEDFARRVVDGSIKKAGKTLPLEEMKPHQYKIDVVRGSQRALLGYHPVSHVQDLVAYCVGDKDKIEEILKEYGYITHIGGRRRSGFGHVLDVIVEPCDEALELWVHRIRPWRMSKSDVPVFATTKAPYWEKRARGNNFCTTKCLW